MTTHIVEDATLRCDGDYETHEVRYSDGSRMKYALNTRTGGVLKDGLYDWPSRLRHAYVVSLRFSQTAADIALVPFDGPP